MRNRNYAFLILSLLTTAKSFSLEAEDFKNFKTSIPTNIQYECEKNGDRLLISTKDLKAWQYTKGSTNTTEALEVGVSDYTLGECEHSFKMKLALPELGTDDMFYLNAEMGVCQTQRLQIDIKSISSNSQMQMNCKLVDN